MEEVKIINFDFNKPTDARYFLAGLNIKGVAVTQIVVKSGKTIPFETMTDDEAMDYASQLYTEWMGDQSVIKWDPPKQTS